MTVSVILYVWQNIEVMQIKIDYRRASRSVEKLIRKKQRLLYEIERYREMDTIKRYADKHNLKEMTPDDFDVITVNKNDDSHKTK